MVYMGSKARLAKHLAPIIQSYITPDTVGYLEPFVGGANMIQHIKHEKRYGSDINKYLIALLKYSQDLNNILPETISEEEYRKVKNNKDNYDDWYVGLVGFCATFGGKYFGGYARDSYDIVAKRIISLAKQRSSLHSINFKSLPFNDIRELKNFTIYCDPPYFGTTAYNFKSFNHEIFWDWVRDYSKNNIVLVSEYKAPNDFEVIFEKKVITKLTKDGTAYKPDVERVFKWKD